MNKNDNGWGAFQNMKKENQNLKKGIVVQNENSYGERICLDKYNNFKNISSRVNPFRFSDSIKNDVLLENIYTNDKLLMILIIIFGFFSVFFVLILNKSKLYKIKN